jgi:RND family efflux transporter MFP subunit
MGLLWAGLCLLPLGCGRAEPPPEEAPFAPVKAEAAETEVLGQWTELLGTTQPLPGHFARVSAAVEGRVLSVLGDPGGKAISEGQKVEKGDVLVRLDDRIARANRDTAQAALDEMTEQLKQAGYGVALAQIDLDRLEKLRQGKMNEPVPLVTQIELDRARIALKDATSKQRLTEAKQKTAEAQLKALNQQLELYSLRAPISGRLGMVRVAPGQTLTVGTPVAEVLDLGEIDVLCYAPPHVVGRLKLGQTARRGVPKEQDSAKLPRGKVCFLSVQAQPETGNFAVKVRFPNTDLHLLASRVERVLVLTEDEAKRLVIPATALLEDFDPPRVVVVDKVQTRKTKEGKDEKVGKARLLKIEVGVREPGGHVEVRALYDLETKKAVPIEGALFVVEGSHGLHDGDDVRIEEEEHEEHHEADDHKEPNGKKE